MQDAGFENQKALADAIGVTQAAVSKWENGTVPDGSQIVKLCKVLRVSADELLGRIKFGGMERGETWEFGPICPVHQPQAAARHDAARLAQETLDELFQLRKDFTERISRIERKISRLKK